MQGRVRGFVARPFGTENLYKIYAESFKDEKHLEEIVAEAQQIVNAALALPTGSPGRKSGAGPAQQNALGTPLFPPDGMSLGGPDPNSYVDRRQEANQDDGIKHEEQRIAGLEVESGQCHDYEDASDDGISVIAIVASPDELKNRATEGDHEHADEARHHVAVGAVGEEQAQGQLRHDEQT